MKPPTAGQIMASAVFRMLLESGFELWFLPVRVTTDDDEFSVAFTWDERCNRYPELPRICPIPPGFKVQIRCLVDGVILVETWGAKSNVCGQVYPKDMYELFLRISSFFDYPDAEQNPIGWLAHPYEPD